MSELELFASTFGKIREEIFENVSRSTPVREIMIKFPRSI